MSGLGEENLLSKSDGQFAGIQGVRFVSNDAGKVTKVTIHIVALRRLSPRIDGKVDLFAHDKVANVAKSLSQVIEPPIIMVKIVVNRVVPVTEAKITRFHMVQLESLSTSHPQVRKIRNFFAQSSFFKKGRV